MKSLAYALLLALCATAALPSQAVAQDDEAMTAAERARKVEELASKATAAYRAKDYEQAIELFEKAYALEPVPNLLYNIARSYEKLERWDEAIAKYEQFIVAPEVDSEARQSAMKRVDRLREIADYQKDGAGADQPRSATQDYLAQTTNDEPASQPTDVAAWVTTGAGIALIGTGAAFGLMASSSADDVQNGATYDERLAAKDDAETYALIADSAYVAGAVVTGIGIYMLVSDDDGGEAATTTLSPWTTGDGGGATVRVDF